MKRFMLRSKVISYAILLMGAAFYSVAAVAEVLTVKYEAEFEQSGTVVTEFQVDTDAEGVVTFSQTDDGPTYYGYPKEAISGLQVEVGDVIFSADDLQASNFFSADDAYAAVWFDMPLVEGSSPNTFMWLDNSSENIVFGSVLCGTECAFEYPPTAQLVLVGVEYGALSVSVGRVETVDLTLVCEVELNGTVDTDGNCAVETVNTEPYVVTIKAAGKSGRAWTETGENTVTTLTKYARDGDSWSDVPFFESTETVRVPVACYNPGGRNMGVRGQCGK